MNSRSLFMITHIRDPIHLSINSVVQKLQSERNIICEPKITDLREVFEMPLVRVKTQEESVYGRSTLDMHVYTRETLAK